MSDRVKEHERCLQVEAVADFVNGHARRIAEGAGFEWERLPREQREGLAWMVRDVLENLRWVDGCDGGYIRDRRPPPDGADEPDAANRVSVAIVSERVSGETNRCRLDAAVEEAAVLRAERDALRDGAAPAAGRERGDGE